MRMPSGHFAISTRHRRLQRISRWAVAAVYTAALPYVIFVFRAIDRHFSPQIAGNVPLFILILMALVYTLICVKQHTLARGVAMLAAGAVVVLLIMKFEANANKYIHIPEYVLMTWILYQALALDYKGRGLLLLILISTAMLGVVDELLQGIHPQRTYGWKDMTIDTAAGFIGILTLIGIKKPLAGDWTWRGHLKHLKLFLAAVIFGGLTAAVMCICLFDVQAQGSFANIYPRWLLALNGLFAAAVAALIVFFWCNRQRAGRLKPETDLSAYSNPTTALLWVMCPLLILFSMHVLVIWVAIAGLEFR